MAREALFGTEMARTDVVNPVNGRAPYTIVTFHGQRVEFHDGEFTIQQHRDAGTSQAAAYATKINDALFDLAKRAARCTLSSLSPATPPQTEGVREALLADLDATTDAELLAESDDPDAEAAQVRAVIDAAAHEVGPDPRDRECGNCGARFVSFEMHGCAPQSAAPRPALTATKPSGPATVAEFSIPWGEPGNNDETLAKGGHIVRLREIVAGWYENDGLNLRGDDYRNGKEDSSPEMELARQAYEAGLSDARDVCPTCGSADYEITWTSDDGIRCVKCGATKPSGQVEGGQ